MADEEDTPLDRLVRATTGKPAKGYAELFAVDVVAVAAMIPTEKHSTVTAALRDGAARAISEAFQKSPDSIVIWQVSSQVAHLVDVARKSALEKANEPVPEGGGLADGSDPGSGG